MIGENDLSLYKKQVIKGCAFAFRKKIRTDLENSILDYLDENPNSTIEDLKNFFGLPESFADEYILAMDVTERNQTLARAKWTKNTILLLLAVIAFTILIAAVWVIIENSRTAGYYYETIVNG